MSEKLIQEIENKKEFPTKYKEKLKSLYSRYKSDGLDSKEKEILETEIEYHLELQHLKSKYLANKRNFGIKSNEEIQNLISSLENPQNLVSKKDLLELGKIIDKNKSLNTRSDILGINVTDSYRNFVKDNIDFRGTKEAIYETEFIKDFYNFFAIKYRIYIEQRDNIQTIDFNAKGLNLTKDEAIKIIQESKKEIYNKKRNYYKNLRVDAIFLLKNGEKVIQDLSLENDYTLIEKEVEDLSSLINYEVSKKQEATLSEYFDTNGVPKPVLDIFDLLLEKYLGDKEINGKKLKELMEEEGNTKKIHENLKKMLQFILKVESYGGKNVLNKKNSGAAGYYQIHEGNGDYGYEKLYTGSFYNITKKEYENLLKKDKKRKDIRKVWHTTSYQTAINNVVSFFEGLGKKGNIGNNISFVNDNDKTTLELRFRESYSRKYTFTKLNKKERPSIKKEKNNEKIKQSVMDLGIVEQTIIFLIDMFERGVKKQQDVKQMIINALIKGDKKGLKEFYNHFHNTDKKQYNGTALKVIYSALNEI